MEKPGLKDETGAPETQPCDAKDTKSSHERVDSALNTKDLNSLCDQDRKIIQQLEFYFSDSNFRRDNFLKAKAAEDKDGFVAVETLLTFNRLKTLCTDSMKISNIAAYSSKLVVSNDKKSIRRAAPLPEIDNSRFRTIFASKIPIETSLDTLLSIFSDKGSLDVAGVRMRRDKETKSFNGSAFVEYNTENDFKEAKSTSFEFEGSKFEILSLVDFLKKKRRESKVQEENRKRSHTSENISTPEFEKGTILYLEGISPDGVDRESIKSLFSNYGDVGFVVSTLQQYFNLISPLHSCF